MYPLFETIRIEDGRICHPEYHIDRMMRSRQELWGKSAPIDLEYLVHVPTEYQSGTVKCNIHYDKYNAAVTFHPYLLNEIKTLQLVEGKGIRYQLKFSDRSQLQDLLMQKGDSDEIIIVKEGMITDTSFSNLVFSDGKKIVTPRLPLLNGTCRQRLLTEGEIFEADLSPKDIYHFIAVKLINAMRPLEQGEWLSVDSIKGTSR